MTSFGSGQTSGPVKNPGRALTGLGQNSGSGVDRVGSKSGSGVDRQDDVSMTSALGN